MTIGRSDRHALAKAWKGPELGAGETARAPYKEGEPGPSARAQNHQALSICHLYFWPTMEILDAWLIQV
jgi:hypothetical protein